jgi:hypothetical protein
MLRFKWETPISDMTDKEYGNVSDIEKIPDRWEHKNLGHVAELRREHFLPKDEDTRLYVGLEHIEEGTLTLKGVGKSRDVVSGKSVRSIELTFLSSNQKQRRITNTCFISSHLDRLLTLHPRLLKVLRCLELHGAS